MNRFVFGTLDMPGRGFCEGVQTAGHKRPEPRIKLAVLFSPTGDGADIRAPAKECFPELYSGDFSHMNMPALVITGDDDHSPIFSERKDWRADAYRLGPSPKSLLWLNGAGHLFGGISGYDAKETTNESPDMVAAIQRIT